MNNCCHISTEISHLISGLGLQYGRLYCIGTVVWDHCDWVGIASRLIAGRPVGLLPIM
jgi:hypothetical protein